MRPEVSFAIQISWLEVWSAVNLVLPPGASVATPFGERSDALDVPVLARPDHGRGGAGDELRSVAEFASRGGLLMAHAEADEERGGDGEDEAGRQAGAEERKRSRGRVRGDGAPRSARIGFQVGVDLVS